MKRYRDIIITLLLATLILAGAGVWRTRVLRPRAPEHRFQPPTENMPPALLFTTMALGGFRGLIADMLWMRAIRLQETQNVLEIVQLSDWITALEPHFITAWAFHAWNMAYNVSVMFPDHEDRWRWVQHGIRLLRDRALVYNPGHPVLLRELGWIYQHKMGFIMDQAHRHYKTRLAQEMTALFGGPRPDYRELEHNPEIRRQLEARKLHPEIMARLDSEYGPLDWRLPATHALYWSWQGRRDDTSLPGVIGCYQMFYQCMAESFRHGRLHFNPETGLYIATPAIELLPHTMRAYDEALAKFDIPAFHLARANFMAEAVVILYTYNHLRRARELYAELIREYPNPEGDPDFENFVIAGLIHNLPEAPRESVTGLIEGFLFQSYLWTALNDNERANATAGMARLIWDRFMQSRASEDHMQRTGLPPLPELRRQALQRALTELPEELQSRLKSLAP